MTVKLNTAHLNLCGELGANLLSPTETLAQLI